MATNITKSVYINYQNASTYLTASGAPQLGTTSPAQAAIMMWNNGTTGTVTWKPELMNELFPSEHAAPHAFNFMGALSPGTWGSKNCWMELTVDGNVLEKFDTFSSNSETNRTYNNNTVKNMRLSSNVFTNHYIPSSGTFSGGYSVRYFSIELEFWQYNFMAIPYSGNDCINAVEVSNPSPFEGEPVTFTAIPKEECTFVGWYSDRECSQLVSSSISYTIDYASSDITLYAKASYSSAPGGGESGSDTQFLIKKDSSWQNVIRYYKKINDVWVRQQNNESEISNYINTSKIFYIKI